MVRGLHETINWVVKTSKLCNLRCRYCYEWNDLADPARISLAQWEQLLLSIRWYHEQRSRACARSVQTIIVWHGGEPLLLPTEYVASVMRLQRAMLGEELAAGRVVNTLQTNLYRVKDEQLDVLQRERISIGVSMDVIGGVRVDALGRETEHRVAENMDRLARRGIAFGGIAVLAGHTRKRLIDVYEFYEGLGVTLRVLPLFAAPLNVPGASFGASDAELTAALEALFGHWFCRRRAITVYPLVDYLRVVLHDKRGSAQAQYDRELHGEWALLVNTDGRLYQVADAYDPVRSLGNVFDQPLDRILDSDDYRASLARDRRMRAAACGTCRFRGPCNTLPLFESPTSAPPGERCVIAYDMHDFVERYLQDRGVGVRRIEQFLARVLE